MVIINNTDIPTQDIADELATLCEDLQVLPIDETSFEVFNVEDLTDDSGATEHTPVDADYVVDTLYDMSGSVPFNDMSPTIDGPVVVIDSQHDAAAREFDSHIARGEKLYEVIRDFLMDWDGCCIEQTFTPQAIGFGPGELVDTDPEYFQQLLYKGMHAAGIYWTNDWKGWGMVAKATILGDNPESEPLLMLEAWENL